MVHEIIGSLFWARIDGYLSYRNTLEDVARSAGLRGDILNAYRSLGRIPKAEDVNRIATALDLPFEWLISGETRSTYDNLRVEQGEKYDRIRAVVDKLYYSSAEIFGEIELLLGISSEEPRTEDNAS